VECCGCSPLQPAQVPLGRNRSGCQNLTLALHPSPVVPSGYGNASRIPSRALGSAPAQSPSLSSGAGSACGDQDCHGPYLTGADPHVPGTAAPNLPACLTSTCERSAPAQTARAPSESSPSRRTTRAPWPYSHPKPCRTVDEVGVRTPTQGPPCPVPFSGDAPTPGRPHVSARPPRQPVVPASQWPQLAGPACGARTRAPWPAGVPSRPYGPCGQAMGAPETGGSVCPNARHCQR
jgi:hypothetical protein